MAAAQAGYKIAAFDIFNDAETRRFSLLSRQVAFHDGGFDADDLLSKLVESIPEGTPLIFGSGLEGQSETLKRIADLFPVVGNDGDVLASVKQPVRFFSLLDELNIAHPDISLQHRAGADWLSKKSGGSGGTHIRFQGQGDYWQRYVEGVPVSVLFLANGQHIEVVGFNEQWTAPTAEMPFRYGGIVGGARLPEQAQAVMAEAAANVTGRVALRGLNSMDFILPADGMPLALEVNPRLSASLDLYDSAALIEWHLRCSQGEHPPVFKRQAAAKASLVYYAPADLAFGNVAWPAWTADRPIPQSLCRAGEPVCTILADASDASSAKALAFARAHELDAQLQTLTIPPGK